MSSPKDRKQELDGFVVSEMGSSGGKPSEVANASAPVELPGGNSRNDNNQACIGKEAFELRAVNAGSEQ